jgi:hypothetical protein
MAKGRFEAKFLPKHSPPPHLRLGHHVFQGGTRRFWHVDEVGVNNLRPHLRWYCQHIITGLFFARALSATSMSVVAAVVVSLFVVAAVVMALFVVAAVVMSMFVVAALRHVSIYPPLRLLVGGIFSQQLFVRRHRAFGRRVERSLDISSKQGKEGLSKEGLRKHKSGACATQLLCPEFKALANRCISLLPVAIFLFDFVVALLVFFRDFCYQVFFLFC